MILQVELMDVRAKALLENLAAMDLIKIHSTAAPNAVFSDLLNKLRQSSDKLSLEEITVEVEAVRTQRKTDCG